MTLKDILTYCKQHIDCPVWRVSKLDEQYSKSITIYDGAPGRWQMTLGHTNCEEKYVQVLIHWGNNPTEAEEKAAEVYNFLKSSGFFYINDCLCFSMMERGAPVYLGVSSDGVYEYTVTFVIVSNKSKK